MIAAHTDLRPALLPVRQQSRRYSCLAFASTTAHEHKTASGEYLCVEYLFYHSVTRTPGKNPRAGTTMQAAAEALALEGQPVETAWPYSATDVVPWTPPAIASPMLRAQLSVGALSSPEIVAMLDRGRPVVLGLVVTDAFYRPDAAGLVEVRTPDPDRAGHAVLAVGYSGKSASDAALLIRNSWGAGWGSGGYGWLTKAYVERQLRETAVLT